MPSHTLWVQPTSVTKYPMVEKRSKRGSTSGTYSIIIAFNNRVIFLLQTLFLDKENELDSGLRDGTLSRLSDLLAQRILGSSSSVEAFGLDDSSHLQHPHVHFRRRKLSHGLCLLQVRKKEKKKEKEILSMLALFAKLNQHFLLINFKIFFN